MQKRTFDHRKAQCCVSKANAPRKFARKIEAIMSFKFEKKSREKRTPPTKKRFGLRIRKKYAERASGESKLRFLYTTTGYASALWWMWIL